MRLPIGLVLGCSLVLAGSLTVHGQQDLDSRVQGAISRGLEYLRSQQTAGGTWEYSHSLRHQLGMTALAALAMIENGVSPADPAIQAAAANVRELAISSDQTYDISLAILLLTRLRGASEFNDDPLIQTLGHRLSGGHVDGRWNYRVPLNSAPEGVEGVPLEVRERPLLVTPSNGLLNPMPHGDNSNTQFALLGLWAAGRAGFDANDGLAAIDVHFRNTVDSSGGWGYRPNNGPRDSMTCAGLMGLAIAAARSELAERLNSRARGAALAADPVFQAALDRVTADAQRIGSGSQIYYLWSLERVCVALGIRELDGLDWYAVGAEELLKRQRPDGSWHGRWKSLPETALALLFLRKANLAFELDRVLRLPRSEDPQADPKDRGAAPIVLVQQPPDEVEPTDDVSVLIGSIDKSGFPEIAVDFEVRNPDDTPLLDAREEDFRVFEDSNQVEVIEFEAPKSVEQVQTTVVLVVDYSGSMAEIDASGARKIDTLKRAVRTFLELIPEGSQVAVVAFSDAIRVISPFTTDTTQVRRAVDQLEPDGGTRYYDAVVEALNVISEVSGRRALVALTDGEDTSSNATLSDAAVAAQSLGLPLYTLGLGQENAIASDELRELAQLTRGQYFPARDADQLVAIYEEIAVRLGQMYRLVYRTPRPNSDGTLRPVSIFYRESVQGGQSQILIRGMVVPSGQWPRLFLFLVAGLVGLSFLPWILKQRIASTTQAP